MGLLLGANVDGDTQLELESRETCLLGTEGLLETKGPCGRERALPPQGRLALCSVEKALPYQ